MPIGSFESAWEEYDHAEGPALKEEAKANNKFAVADAPNWRLLLSGENFTRRLVSAEVTFSREGESSMRFVVAGNLRAFQYERATVSFWFGYGTKLVPWFRGRLAEPVDAISGLYSEASAYGWATQLGQRTFQQRVDYGEWDLREAVADIWERFGALPERFDFWGTHTTTLAKDIGEFGLEVTLLEGLQTVLEPMQFIGYDAPYGMYIVKRSHLAELGTDMVYSGAGHYEPEDYPMNGFTFDQSMANFYSDVTIFRRKDEFAGGGGPGVSGAGPAGDPDTNPDEYDVYATHTVADPGPFTVNEGRDYVVADYPGQQEHAEREAELLATSFSRGVGHFEWQCPPIDFEIGDHLTVVRHEQIHAGAAFGNHANYYLSQIDAVSYGCVVTDITFSLAASGGSGETSGTQRWAMTVSGYAFEKDRETIREPEGPTSIDILVPPDEPEDIDSPVDVSFVLSGEDEVYSGDDRVVVPS